MRPHIKRFILLLCILSFTNVILYLCLTLFQNIRSGLVEQAFQSSEAQEIVVTPKVRTGLFRIQTDEKPLSEENIEKIKNIPHVQDSFLTRLFTFPNSLRISLFGNVFESDILLYSVEYESVKNDIDQNILSSLKDDEIPIVLSSDLIRLYNTSFSDALGMPKLPQELLIGQDLTILTGYSSFFGNSETLMTFKGKVVGFSKKAPFIGVSIPNTFLPEIVRTTAPDKQKIQSIRIVSESIQFVSDIAKNVEELGFSAQTQEEKLNTAFQAVQYIALIFGFLSFLFLLFSITIYSTIFQLEYMTHKRTFGLLQCLGATKSDIMKITFIQGSLISSLSAILGVVITLIILPSINAFLNNQLLVSAFFQLSSHINFLSALFFILGITCITLACNTFIIKKMPAQNPMLFMK